MKKSNRLYRRTFWAVLVLSIAALYASPALAKPKGDDKSKSGIEDQLKKNTDDVKGVGERDEDEAKRLKEEANKLTEGLNKDGGPAKAKTTVDDAEGVDPAKLDEELKKLEEKNRQIIDKLKGLVAKNANAPGDKVADWRFQIAEYEWEISSYRQMRDMRQWTSEITKQMDSGVPEDQWNKEPTPNFDASIEQYEAIIAQHSSYPRLSEVLFKLGDGLIRAGRPDDGIPKLRLLTQTYPESPYLDAAFLSLAEYYFEKRNTAFAQEFYGKIVNDFPKSKVYNYAQYKLGWTYFNLGDEEGFQDAIKTFRLVVDHLDKQYEKCIDKTTLVLDENCLPKGEVSFRNQAINDLIVAYAEIDGGWLIARDYFKTKLPPEKFRSKMEMFSELMGEKGQHDVRVAIYRWLIEENGQHANIPTYAERIIDSYFNDNKEAQVEQVVREFIDYFQPNGKWALANAGDERASKNARRFAEDKLYSLAAEYLKKALEAAEGGSPAKQEEADRYFTTSRGDHETFLKRYPDSKYGYEMNFYYAYLLDEVSGRALERVKTKHKGKPGEAYIADARAEALPDLKAAAVQYQEVIKLNDKAPAPVDDEAQNFTRVSANRQVFVYANILSTVDPTWSMDGKIGELKKETDEIKEAIALSAEEKDFVGSVEQYSKLFNKHEDTPGFLWRAAELYKDKNHYGEAANRYDDLVSNFPDHAYAGYAINSMFQLYNKAKNWPKIEFWAEWLIEKKNFKVYKQDQLEDAVAYSIQQQSNDLYAAKDFKASAEKIYSIKTRFPERHNLVTPAVFITARIYRDGNLVAPAIKHFEEFVAAYPTDNRTPVCVYDLAQLYERKTDFNKSAELFEALPDAIAKVENAGAPPPTPDPKAKKPATPPKKPAAKEEPKAEEKPAEEDFLAKAKELSPDALVSAFFIRKGLQQWDKAITSANIYLTNYPDGKYAEEFAFRIAEVYQSAEQHDKAMEAFNAYMAKYPENTLAHIQAHLSMARSIEAKGGAERTIEKEQDEHFAQMETLAAKLSGEEAGRAGDFLAEMHFTKAERLFKQMKAVQLEFPQSVLNKRIQEKLALIKQCNEAYQKVLDLKQARWSAAAAFRRGDVAIEFRDQIKNLPIPKEIQNDEMQLEEYNAFIEDNVIFPMEDMGRQGFTFALDLAHKLKVYNEWSRKSAGMMTQLLKAEYPVTSEAGVTTEYLATIAEAPQFVVGSADRKAPKKPAADTNPSNPANPANPDGATPPPADGAAPPADGAAPATPAAPGSTSP